jgi:uncharacterized membrane protein YidH (DUF202 family)
VSLVRSSAGDRIPTRGFSLANERAFLAWIRTSLALIAGGVALEALALPVQPGYGAMACSAPGHTPA